MDSPPSDGIGSNSTAMVLVVLLTAFFLLGFFLIYVNRCTSSEPAEEAGRAQYPANPPHPFDVPPQGVDAAFLETLPLVTYSSSQKKGSNVECVVCLTDFNEGEPLCQLPRCKHVFHKECIDVWLYSHTTCPLCRRSVLSSESRSFRWGGSGSLRLSLARRSRRESERGSTPEPSTPGEGHASLLQRDANANMELDGLALTGASRSFPRSHSTGHLLAVKKGESSMSISVGTPNHSNTGDAKPRTGCSSLTPAAEFRRSRSMVAVREDGPAPVSMGLWMREARASLRRALSLKKMSPAAADFGIPVGLAASSSARSTFDRLSPV